MSAFPHYVSKTDAARIASQTRHRNVPRSPGSPFILGSKGHKTIPACVFALVRMLADSSSSLRTAGAAGNPVFDSFDM